jgi:tetratricopeptide (TPR) repeat protein
VGELLSDVTAVTRVQTGISRVEYLRTELAVVATYLRLLVLPVGQNVDHDFPLASSFLEPRVLWAMAVIGGLVAVAALLFHASSRRGERRADPATRLVAVGIVWFFLTLAVESSVIPIVDVMFEHRVYLPSVGFFVAVATAGALLARRPRAVVALGASLALALALATLARNRVWADQLSLWSDAALGSPQKSRPQNNIAAALTERGRLREAEPHAIAGIQLDPGNAEAYYNLGRIRLQEARYEESLLLFRDAVRLKRDYPDAYANMAGALNRLRRGGETIETLEPVAAIIRDNPAAQFNLGVAYWMSGRVEEARRQVGILRALDPSFAAQLERYIAGWR